MRRERGGEAGRKRMYGTCAVKVGGDPTLLNDAHCILCRLFCVQDNPGACQNRDRFKECRGTYCTEKKQRNKAYEISFSFC